MYVALWFNQASSRAMAVRYPQDTTGILRIPRYPQDAIDVLRIRGIPRSPVVSSGYRVLRIPARVLGYGVPRTPPPILYLSWGYAGVLRMPPACPRTPTRVFRDEAGERAGRRTSDFAARREDTELDLNLTTV